MRVKIEYVVKKQKNKNGLQVYLSRLFANELFKKITKVKVMISCLSKLRKMDSIYDKTTPLHDKD